MSDHPAGVEQEFWRLAARFVEFVHGETRLPLIVCDGQGIIREAVVKSRIGTAHAGAQRIVRGEVDEAFVTAEEAAADPSVKEGYNCPIVVGGRRLGTFGIAGPLEVSRPMARVAAAVLSSWLKELEHRQALSRTAGQVVEALDAISAKLGSAAEVSKATLARTESASQAAAERLGAVDSALQAVQGIAQQSRMLAINASVEATRAGDAGRAFGVIAREMLGLADGARLTSNTIQGTLRDVAASVRQLDEAGRASSAEAAAAVETLREVAALLSSLRSALEDQGAGRELSAGRADARRIGSSSR
jgi:hypothetical protein